MVVIDLNFQKEMMQFYYPFFRITGMMLYAPILGSFLISIRIRIVLSILVAYLVSRLIDTPTIEIISINGFFMAISQLLIGYIFAFVLQMGFQAVTVAGETISMSMGLAFAQIVDPSNGHNVPLLSQLFLVFITLYFISIDMHLFMMQVFALSFYHIPVDQLFNINVLYGLILSGSTIFLSALLIALPILTILLSINIIMGVMSRAAPQLNIFTVGFPMTLFLGYVAVLIFMADIIETFSQVIQARLDYFSSLMPDMVQ